MTDNRLLLWSIVCVVIYTLAGIFIPGVYISGFTSLALLMFGGVTFFRYAPEAYRILFYQQRNSVTDGDGSHLAAYGVTLLSCGSIYIGVFGIVWALNDQPVSWTGNAASGFGRIVMATGYALLWISPDVTQKGLKFSVTIWLIVIAVLSVIAAFFVGFHVGTSGIDDIIVKPYFR